MGKLPDLATFDAMRHLSVSRLMELPDEEWRPLLSCIARFFLLQQQQNNTEEIWNRVHNFPEINSIVSIYRKIDFEYLGFSLSTDRDEWILANFKITEGKCAISDFECNFHDANRRFGLVLRSLVHLQQCFKSVMNGEEENSIIDWELLDCSAHWLGVVNIIHAAIIELPDHFNAVDVAELFLMLRSDANGSKGSSFGSLAAWWLLAAHPNSLIPFIERILTWKLPLKGDSALLQRLSTNRLDFFSSNKEMFDENPSLMTTLFGNYTLSQAIITYIDQQFETLLEQYSSDFLTTNKLLSLLTLLFDTVNSDSFCLSNLHKGQTLSSTLKSIMKYENQYPEESGMIKKLREKLHLLVSKLLSEWDNNGIVPTSNILSITVHLLCIFQLQFSSSKLSDDEVKIVVSLFRADYPIHPSYLEIVSELMCFGCATSELAITEEFPVFLSKWLNLWRQSRRANLDTVSTIGELIIQIGLQCYASSSPGLAASQTQCQNSLASIISSKLKIDGVNINSNLLITLRKVFLNQVLPENKLAESVLLVEASAIDLSASTALIIGENPTGKSVMLASACVLTLLRSPLFVKHDQHLLLRDWLETQLHQGLLTQDPLFQFLLQNQTQSNQGMWSNTSTEVANPLVGLVKSHDLVPMVDETKRRLFNSDEHLSDNEISHLVNQLLGILFYTLTSIDVFIFFGRNEGKTREVLELLKLVENMPVKVILYSLDKHSDMYSHIYPAFIRLLYQYFPHICHVGDCLALYVFCHEVQRKQNIIKKDMNLHEKLNLILNENFATRPGKGDFLISLLPEFFDSITSNTLSTSMATIIKASKNQQTYTTAKQFADIFFRTAVAFNTRQIGIAARKLVGPSPPPVSSLAVIDGDLSLHFVVEPLAFLTNLDKRVLNNPILLEIALWLLSRLLAANQQFFANRIMIQNAFKEGDNPIIGPLPPGVLVPVDNTDKEAAVALSLLQQCECVLFLMDRCAKSKSEISGSLLVEVQAVICSFVHQLYLRNHQLVKLVHFQTYPLDAVPIAVALIPSMHVCLDFLPELMTTTSTTRQVFSVTLLSYITSLFPITRSFALAKLAVDVIDTMVTTMTSDKRIEYFSSSSSILKCLERICSTFPPLVEDVIHLILRVYSMAKSLNGASLALASPWSRPMLRSNQKDIKIVRKRLKNSLQQIVKKTKLCRVLTA